MLLCTETARSWMIYGMCLLYMQLHVVIATCGLVKKGSINFFLQSQCNSLFTSANAQQISAASVIHGHDGRSQRKRNCQARDN